MTSVVPKRKGAETLGEVWEAVKRREDNSKS